MGTGGGEGRKRWGGGGGGGGGGGRGDVSGVHQPAPPPQDPPPRPPPSRAHHRGSRCGLIKIKEISCKDQGGGRLVPAQSPGSPRAFAFEEASLENMGDETSNG